MILDLNSNLLGCNFSGNMNFGKYSYEFKGENKKNAADFTIDLVSPAANYNVFLSI